VFRPQKTHKKTTIKLYNTLALPVLLYGSETGTVKARDARRITAAEMQDRIGQITKQIHKLQRN
jgi:transcriptional regulator with AAA-type ATPase domain